MHISPSGSFSLMLNAFQSLFGLAATVLTFVSLWKIFTKAGKPGWHAIIPFLNVYTLCRIAWNKGKGVLIIVLEAIGIFFSFVGIAVLIMSAVTSYSFFGHSFFDLEFLKYPNAYTGGMLAGLLIFLFGMGVLFAGAIVTLVAYVKLGKSFGKQGGFLVGMFFLPVIFCCILAFGNDSYIGPDGVPEAGYRAPGGMSEPKNKFCRSCGTKLEPDAKFCPNCGQPVDR